MTDQSSTDPHADDHGTDPRDLVAELESVDETSTAADASTGADASNAADLPSDTGDTELPGDAANRTDVATAGGTHADGADADVADDGEDPGAGRHGPMVSDAAIDWSTLDGGGALPGVPTDPQPSDGDAPAP